MKKSNAKIAHLFFNFIFIVCLSIKAQNATSPGQVTTPYPTIINIGIEWAISGDNNWNGKVDVEYRKTGETQWQDAMPLRRVPAGSLNGKTWTNKHAGSLFDLQPGTEYEIHLTLTDPDGGSMEKTVTASTRPVPRVPDNAEIITFPSGYHGNLSVKSGTADKPVVYRSDNCEAVFGTVSLAGKQYVYLEELSFKGPNGEAGAGIGVSGAQNCVVRRCSIYAETGITAGFPMSNCYISDNVIKGTARWSDPDIQDAGIGSGLVMIGAGNVICYNRISNSSDLVGFWEWSSGQDIICNDFYGNDLREAVDDPIEGDYSMTNNRFIRNRITNCYMGLSSQPSLGGPTYWVRNVLYNILNSSYKFHLGSTGNVVLHNTVIKPGDGMNCVAADNFKQNYFRNNLAIGGPSSGCEVSSYGCGSGYGASMSGAGGTGNSFDYDAVGSENGSGNGSIGGSNFLSAESHGIGGIRLSSTFNSVSFPNPAKQSYVPPDLRPKGSAPVVNKGLAIPNINDGYSGSAPDIGAYESGQDLPHYGPRPAGIDEQTPYDNTSTRPVFSSSIVNIPIFTANPNPFTNTTSIVLPFSNTGKGASPMLSIYSIKGEKVASLLPANGRNTFLWNGRGERGDLLPKGIYFLKTNGSKQKYCGKVMYLK